MSINLFAEQMLQEQGQAAQGQGKEEEPLDGVEVRLLCRQRGQYFGPRSAFLAVP